METPSCIACLRHVILVILSDWTLVSFLTSITSSPHFLVLSLDVLHGPTSVLGAHTPQPSLYHATHVSVTSR